MFIAVRRGLATLLLTVLVAVCSGCEPKIGKTFPGVYVTTLLSRDYGHTLMFGFNPRSSQGNTDAITSLSENPLVEQGLNGVLRQTETFDYIRLDENLHPYLQRSINNIAHARGMAEAPMGGFCINSSDELHQYGAFGSLISKRPSPLPGGRIIADSRGNLVFYYGGEVIKTNAEGDMLWQRTDITGFTNPGFLGDGSIYTLSDTLLTIYDGELNTVRGQLDLRAAVREFLETQYGATFESAAQRISEAYTDNNGYATSVDNYLRFFINGSYRAVAADADGLYCLYTLPGETFGLHGAVPLLIRMDNQANIQWFRVLKDLSPWNYILVTDMGIADDGKLYLAAKDYGFINAAFELVFFTLQANNPTGIVDTIYYQFRGGRVLTARISRAGEIYQNNTIDLGEGIRVAPLILMRQSSDGHFLLTLPYGALDILRLIIGRDFGTCLVELDPDLNVVE